MNVCIQKEKVIKKKTSVCFCCIDKPPSLICGKSLTLHFVGAKGKPQSISPTFWDSIWEVFPLWEGQRAHGGKRLKIKQRERDRAESVPELPWPLTAL